MASSVAPWIFAMSWDDWDSFYFLIKKNDFEYTKSRELINTTYNILFLLIVLFDTSSN